MPCAYHLVYSLVRSESPYPEVRAAVSSVDDPLMPVNTFRMWVFLLLYQALSDQFPRWLLGLLATILVSGLNQIFSLRCMFKRFSCYIIP